MLFAAEKLLLGQVSQPDQRVSSLPREKQCGEQKEFLVNGFYQNELCLVMPAGLLTGSPIGKKLRQLRNFLKKHDILQEGN